MRIERQDRSGDACRPPARPVPRLTAAAAFLRRGAALAIAAPLLSAALAGGCGGEPEAPRRAPEAAAPRPAEPPARASDFSVAGLEAEEVRQFLASLKEAVAADDRAKVAGMVSYPLTAGSRTLESAADFVLHYSEVMTQAVRDAVAGADPATLFVNYQGVRLGRGEVWIGGVYPDGKKQYEVKILAINGVAPAGR